MCYCPDVDPQDLLQIYKKQIPNSIFINAFVPTCERMKRYQGEWHTEEKPAFPGYIFLESSQTKKYSDAYVKESVLLRPEQQKFLKELIGTDRHMKMSIGYIQNGCTHITEGPLCGYEKFIRKIDRHKRLAKLEFPTANTSRELYAGLEIVSKS